MIVLGLILLTVGYLLHISILSTIGIVVLVVGVVLMIMQLAGHGVGNRYWY